MALALIFVCGASSMGWSSDFGVLILGAVNGCGPGARAFEANGAKMM